MADGGKDEKRYIGGFAKSLKKYGSTCNHMKTQEKLIKHTVSKSDTLQGIALKYGVTMEQIRRINRLWASDSLFLRENLLIPTPDHQRELSTPELEAALASPLSSFEFLASASQDPATSPIMRECVASESQENVSAQRTEDEKSVLQFLGEIDNSIAHTKNMVKKIQVSSNFREEEQEGVAPVGKRRPLHSRLHPNHQGAQNHRNTTKPNNHHVNNKHHNNHGGSSEEDKRVGIEPLPPVVLTQGKKVRSSMQRLEQEADEMFEL
ncbi:lysM and putative peptidoglycan-binding domain-containing protein 2 [Ischnura elegans]|uniref:lysM and putative peptidoglycan-binding domain-containing protein 2 n=1 Tax=Ischnura elegans TaxID=197161 RepID=UPI001ED8A228|nr:lysM and putative peptidoglycan-binding domain-containing protein 2 [Ischnura elegans]